ncbi:MAG: restriction endonuclease subunit S [Caulobacteraceae bacterium]|nr:restriction endonuclease subunit S [Caulobacteraceae bacterium]
MTLWPTAALGDVSRPRQWPILSKADMAASGFPVFGANGQIGFATSYTHKKPILLIGCRGSCGTVHVAPALTYANGNAMALDALDTRRVDLHFLAAFLKMRGFEDVISGSSQPQITRQNIVRVEVPLPPLDEQRRIAAVLDQAHALSRKRREVLNQLDAFARAIFDQMFGDPVGMTRGWPKVRFETLLKLPLRNGVSPASGGVVSATVLTLSAITGSRFEERSTKVGEFKASPSEHQRVNRSDFLICRGNGNKSLVGRGFFPEHDMPNVVFPDTIIAGRIDTRRTAPAFLQFVWNAPATRRQIEAKTRTTNGTFKVNQTMIEAVELVDPPLDLQRSFSEKLAAVEEQRSSYRRQLDSFDALFASLQHRAFRGEL